MIDWNELWKIMMFRRQKILNIKFWDLEAINSKSHDELMKDLTKKQIEKIELSPDETLLEIGPGWGRLTIPLAKIAKEVCVIEPSKKMIKELLSNAKLHGLKNIKVINKRWEEVENIPKYDVILASFSLLLLDLKGALKKMDSLANKRVYIFASADEWMPKEIQRIILNEHIKTYSDHMIIFNLLYTMEIRANVEIIEYEYRRNFDTFEKALKTFSEIYNIPKHRKKSLNEYLKNSLIRESNGLFYKDLRRGALIWWKK